jgi:3-oxoacyl-[acyl-carrier-protein] synthase I
MSVAMPPLAVTAFTATSALGAGLAAHRQALAEGRGGLRQNDFSHAPLACWIGRIDGLEALVPVGPLRHWDSRNNRLAWLGLQQDGFADAVAAARARHGARRIAVFMGTSTGSIASTEAGYRQLDNGRLPPSLQRPELHALHALGAFVADALELDGPCTTVSTACSSSAKVFGMAERMLRLGWIDAAVVGGVDSLCESTLFGFNALELVAPEPCRPFDAQRCGLSIGEAAGFALLQREDGRQVSPQLVGYGESSDAHHMSSPHPQGLGADMAMREAMTRAGLQPHQVDYINLHGTATAMNDRIEAARVAALFPASTRASSTKGYTGHTLGAAGILEAVITLLALELGLVPGTLGCRVPDDACGPQLAIAAESCPLQVALSNSFGFGGNNACLALRRAGAA